MGTAARKIVSLATAVALFAAFMVTPVGAVAKPAAGSSTKIATTLTAKASGKGASIYKKVKLTATLKANNKGVKRVKLLLQSRPTTEAAWADVRRAETNARGIALVNVRPANKTYYRFVFKGNAKYEASDSAGDGDGIVVAGYKAPSVGPYAGVGTASTPEFKLRAGLAVFSFESTSTTFSAKLLKAGTPVASFDSTGEAAVKISETATYTVSVVADAGSPWTMKVKQPRQLTGKSQWTTFKGTGNQVSDVYNLKRKSYKFAWTNASGATLTISLRDQAGKSRKIVTTSKKTGKIQINKIPKGLYVLVVDSGDAAAEWRVVFKK